MRIKYALIHTHTHDARNDSVSFFFERHRKRNPTHITTVVCANFEPSIGQGSVRFVAAASCTRMNHTCACGLDVYYYSHINGQAAGDRIRKSNRRLPL